MGPCPSQVTRQITWSKHVTDSAPSEQTSTSGLVSLMQKIRGYPFSDLWDVSPSRLLDLSESQGLASLSTAAGSILQHARTLTPSRRGETRKGQVKQSQIIVNACVMIEGRWFGLDYSSCCGGVGRLLQKSHSEQRETVRTH